MKYLTLVSLMLGTAFADYASEAESAIKLLQNKWYSTETGLWYVPITVHVSYTDR